MAPLSTMLLLILMLLVVECSWDVAAATGSEKEIEECAEQLAGLASCLPYVGGTAKSPTQDCCGGLKDLLKSNKKCLCVVIKDRDDPQLGLHIDLSLAISLPSVCSVSPSPNISKCPELLHMDKNSPEAQVFYQLGNNSSTAVSGPSPGSAPSPAAVAGSGGSPNVVGAISGSNQGKQTSDGNKSSSHGGSLLGILCLWGIFFSFAAFFRLD